MLGLYRKLIAASIRAQMQYKMNFITSAATTGMIMVLDFVVLSAILHRFDNVAGWNIYEVGMLYGISSTSVSLYRLFAPELHEFEKYVVHGEFDQMLIRPVSPLMLLLTRNLDLSRIGGVVQGVAVLVVALAGFAAEGRPIGWLALFSPVAIMSGGVIYFSMALASAALSFWTHQMKDMLTFTIYAPANASNYPISLYPGWLKWLFFSALPIAYMNYLPMLTLLGKGGGWYYPLAAPVAATVALLLARAFWNTGIRHYHSTGS
ncbi:ABC-2 family transporter protein [Brevibacillus agri]|uniref:ABC transporter permease n=1 Tax=Brevibacillus agri TaxID=51101 RepID=UPI002E1D4E4E|nr:ABC-2 family transporter protein [Brevibacillus agri]MED1653462.1 ABC-2 family transporter protein [Brevibacillus agri]MED1685297.1 ABC-2 family transporter protein [Brevibacillus agri]MED1690694.1 ABC-2 family transporter protein [Brevibacillus agri]MED1697499.1 ABC-2 family transporter protein [Brevibacillus agri]